MPTEAISSGLSTRLIAVIGGSPVALLCVAALLSNMQGYWMFAKAHETMITACAAERDDLRGKLAAVTVERDEFHTLAKRSVRRAVWATRKDDWRQLPEDAAGLTQLLDSLPRPIRAEPTP